LQSGSNPRIGTVPLSLGDFQNLPIRNSLYSERFYH
jgi:hypothetical protein